MFIGLRLIYKLFQLCLLYMSQLIVYLCFGLFLPLLNNFDDIFWTCFKAKSFD